MTSPSIAICLNRRSFSLENSDKTPLPARLFDAKVPLLLIEASELRSQFYHRKMCNHFFLEVVSPTSDQFRHAVAHFQPFRESLKGKNHGYPCLSWPSSPEGDSHPVMTNTGSFLGNPQGFRQAPYFHLKTRCPTDFWNQVIPKSEIFGGQK